MCLGIALFEERKPCFLRVLALSKIERAAVGLIDLSIGLLRAISLNVVEQDPVEEAFIVVWFNEIELHSC